MCSIDSTGAVSGLKHLNKSESVNKAGVIKFSRPLCMTQTTGQYQHHPANPDVRPCFCVFSPGFCWFLLSCILLSSIYFYFHVFSCFFFLSFCRCRLRLQLPQRRYSWAEQMFNQTLIDNKSRIRVNLRSFGINIQQKNRYKEVGRGKHWTLQKGMGDWFLTLTRRLQRSVL